MAFVRSPELRLYACCLVRVFRPPCLAWPSPVAAFLARRRNMSHSRFELLGICPQSRMFSRVITPFSNFLNHPRGKPTIKPMTNNDTINTTGSARDTQTQASLSSRPPSCLSDPPPSLSRGIASPGISPPPCKTSWGSRQSILKRELWRGTRR